MYNVKSLCRCLAWFALAEYFLFGRVLNAENLLRYGVFDACFSVFIQQDADR